MVGTQFLNLVLSTKDFGLIKNTKDIDQLFIIPEEKQVFDFICNHWRKYGQVPDKHTILRQFPDFELYEVEESPQALLHEMREYKLATELEPVIRKSAELYVESPVNSVNYMMQEIPRLSKLITTDVNLFDYTKSLDMRLADYEMRANIDGMMGIPTGLPSLDADTLGWWRGHLNIVGGRLNEGKTWVGLLFAKTAWEHGYRVGFWSLESGKDEMAYRLDALIGHFSNKALFGGNLSEEEFEEYKQFLNNLRDKNPLYIFTNEDNGGERWTAKDIARVVEEQSLDLVVIDQASLMGDSRHSRQIRERFVNIATDCKYCAVETNIPWILLVQLNRLGAKTSQDEVPGIETIAESDAFGQFADRAILIKQVPPLMKLALRKNRFGQKDIEYLCRWDVDRGIISELGNVQGEDAF